MTKSSTVYQAIFETDTHVVSVSYEPGPEGAIFITSVTLTERPKSQWEERQAERRRARYVQPSLWGKKF